MITLEKLQKDRNWCYFGSVTPETRISGWKLHFWGTTVEDALELSSRLTPVFNKWKMYGKVASQFILDIGIADEIHPQYGKCATAYITADVFQDHKGLPTLLDDMSKALEGYTPTNDPVGDIHGDKQFLGPIFYRYELSQIVEPSIGCDMDEYGKLYESNRGAHNITGNPDPFQEIIDFIS